MKNKRFQEDEETARLHSVILAYFAFDSSQPRQFR